MRAPGAPQVGADRDEPDETADELLEAEHEDHGGRPVAGRGHDDGSDDERDGAAELQRGLELEAPDPAQQLTDEVEQPVEDDECRGDHHRGERAARTGVEGPEDRQQHRRDHGAHKDDGQRGPESSPICALPRGRVAPRDKRDARVAHDGEGRGQDDEVRVGRELVDGQQPGRDDEEEICANFATARDTNVIDERASSSRSVRAARTSRCGAC